MVDTVTHGRGANPLLRFQSDELGAIDWIGAEILSDDLWANSFGAWQRRVRGLPGPALVTLDLSRVEWADPLPMLSLCTTIRELLRSETVRLHVVMGEVDNVTQRRGGFLKFLVQQRFIHCLWVDGRTTFTLGSKVGGKEEDLVALLEAVRTTTIYSNSRCLTARLIFLDDKKPPEDPRDEERWLDAHANAIVSEWLREIDEHCLRRIFERDPELISNVQVKLRIILLELLLNVAEHAYHQDSDASKMVGVMVRIRRSEDSHQSRQVLQEAIHRENQRCPVLRRFHRTSNDKWLEVFVVDNGCGLAADLDEWIARGSPRLRPVLRKVKATTNILQPLARILFSHPISRLSRVTTTTVTGLQHVSFVLAEQFDFSRLYSMGEWIGNTHPWDSDRHEVIASSRKRHGIENTPVGTAWHFCLSLVGTEDGDVDDIVGTWNRIPTASFDSSEAHPAKPEDWTIFDERDLGQGARKYDWVVDTRVAHPTSMWLPGAITKQHIHSWLTAARRTAIDRPDIRHFWLVADLAPREAKLFFEVLSRERFNDRESPSLDVFLVTYTWHSIGLGATAQGFRVWASKRQDAMASRGSRPIFELIRHRDSVVFWRGILGSLGMRSPQEEPTSAGEVEEQRERARSSESIGPFVAEEVIWSRDIDGRAELVLDGYLDVTEALAEPERAGVSRRALRRCWYALERRLPCIAADGLLESMLPRERRAGTSEWYAGGQHGKADHVLINSVSVTGMTIRNSGRHRGEVIHLLYHSPRAIDRRRPSDTSPSNGRIALEWHVDSRVLREREPNSLPYERIPGTPYIGRGGAKAIPVRRFHRPDEVDPGAYFKRSIYEADPQETYDQFDRLNVLKIGHWSYGAHHQLLTVNLGKAIESESIDRGPLLRWLLGQLEELAGRGADLVIYPSHRVTDGLVRSLKRLSVELNRNLPRTFIPVHSLGRHAQTAIRIPSLTYDRIKAALRGSEVPKAVILDDAAVTGKVQREFGQLLRNAGAEEVLTVGILTRTGIPLYRHYLVSEYSDKNRFYWRWDVPSLGMGRYCPLCSAINLAGSLKGSLALEESSSEVESWIKSWTQCPVETHWERGGLTPGPLPSLREISFGKEWPRNGTPPTPYPMFHRTTTGLAATVAELIRVTAYKEVGLKIARRPAGRDLGETERSPWLRCVAEILIVQTLLFLDDFEFGELEPRMSDLADLLLELELQPEDSLDLVPLELQQLICLILLLAPVDILPYVADRILNRAGSIEHASHRTLLTVGLLLQQTPDLTWTKLVKSASNRHTDPEARRRAVAFLSRSYATVGRKASDSTVQACLILFLVLGASDRDSHSGLLRQMLLLKRPESSAAVLLDLQLAASALEQLPIALLQGEAKRPDVSKLAGVLKHAAGDLDRTLQGGASAPALVREFEKLHRMLYLESDGWIGIRDELAPDVEKLIDFLGKCPSLEEWTAYLDGKERSSESAVALPWRGESSTALPIIDVRCELTDLKKRLFCPPVVRGMIKDYMLNVVHSVRRERENHDMYCSLVEEPWGVHLTIGNSCGPSPGTPQQKMSEYLLSTLTDLVPVKVDVDSKGQEVRVAIGLPFMNAIWSKVAK